MSDKQIAIHCRSTEEFNFVCNLFSITNANWFLHESRTCVNLPEKTISDIECNNRDYITGFGYAETYYSELLEKEKQKGYFFTPEQLKQLLEEYTNRITENVETEEIGCMGQVEYTIVDKESITNQLKLFLKEIL